jgi:hypothetical protein
MIAEDSSIEFDLYEDARQRLTRFLEIEGHNQLDAERVAFYIVQGVRAAPKLISLLNQSEESSPTQIRAALNAVFDNLNLLNKAQLILSKVSNENP